MKYERNGFFPRIEISWILKEFDRIKGNAVEYTMGLAGSVTDIVDDEITLEINDETAPYKENTMGQLINTANRILIKYRGDEYGDSQKLCNFAEAITLYDSDINKCCESIRSFFRYDFSMFDEKFSKDVEKLKKAVCNAHYGNSIGGIYDHKTRTITLFSKNLNGREEYILAFARAFFYAVYCCLLERFGSTEKPDRYYHEVVMDSFAEGFMIFYLNEFRGDFSVTAEDVAGYLRERSPLFDSYCCGAKYCLDGYEPDYYSMLEISLYDIKEALRRMVDYSEYEAIICKNRQTKIESLPVNNCKIRKKTVAGKKSPAAYTVNHDSYESCMTPNGFIEENRSYGGTGYSMKKVRKGDIIFNVINDELRSVSVATSDAELLNGQWRIAVDTHKINTDVRYSPIVPLNILLSELSDKNPEDGFLLYLAETLEG